MAALLFFVIALLASLTPIRSYDYFWHLATGRWIVEHHAIPLTDPFAIASAKIPWINGSWLFDVLLYGIYKVGGHAGVAFCRALAIAAFFSTLMLWCARRVTPAVASTICAVALVGAALRLGARPEPVGIALMATLVIVLFETSGALRVALTAAIVVFWVNIHPSALLAPIIAALFTVGTTIDLLRARAARATVRHAVASLALVAFTATAALFINPYGSSAVVAPFRLAAEVGSGAFVNAEWVPSRVAQFPLLYIAILLVALLITYRRFANAAAILLFLFFAALAVRFVRNQGFFFVAVPLVAVWWLPPRVSDRVSAVLRIALITIAVGALTLRFSHRVRLGVDANYFPVAAVKRLQALGLRGHFYNPDQFGGFLIWSFYPEQRALTDGRNELYENYNREYAAARTNNRAWNALLQKYGVTVAVDEYRREPIMAVDPRNGSAVPMPPSLALYPPRQWALVAFDDAAMIYARRDRFPKSELDAVEYRVVRPDDWRPFRPSEHDGAAAEISRARREIGSARVIDVLEERLRSGS